ncbi:hypothetical protein ACLOJK_001391 [Asimina triloba]
MYWESLLKLVITSRNSTKDDLVEEVENLNLSQRIVEDSGHPKERISPFRYLDHIHPHSPFAASGQS